MLGIVGGRNQSQNAVASSRDAIAGSLLEQLPDFPGQRGGLLGAQKRLAPIVDQRELPKVVGRAQRPFHRPLTHGSIACDGIIQSQREPRFRKGRPFNEEIELPPALGLAFPLPLEQPQPLDSENQPGMLSVNPKFVVLSQEFRACRNGGSDHDKTCDPIPNRQQPIVSH